MTKEGIDVCVQLRAACSNLLIAVHIHLKPVSSQQRLFLANNRQLVDLDSEKEVSTRKRTGVKKKNTDSGEFTQKKHTLQNLIDLRGFQ